MPRSNGPQPDPEFSPGRVLHAEAGTVSACRPTDALMGAIRSLGISADMVGELLREVRDGDPVAEEFVEHPMPAGIPLAEAIRQAPLAIQEQSDRIRKLLAEFRQALFNE